MDGLMSNLRCKGHVVSLAYMGALVIPNGFQNSFRTSDLKYFLTLVR